MHEAKVAFLNEVEEWQARCLVLLGNRDHEAQVGLHERALGGFAFFCCALQLTLLGRRESFFCFSKFYLRFFASFNGFG